MGGTLAIAVDGDGAGLAPGSAVRDVVADGVRTAMSRLV
jgi:hypothetical protein